jgi:hypothetical protein
VGLVHVNVGTDRPGGNYTWTAKADVGTVSPSTGQGSGDNFTLKVTAPSTTGDMTISVTLSNGTKSTPASFTVHVVDPVVITAQVMNSGNVTLENVPVQFWADGQVLNQTTFTIAANSTKTLTYNWTSSGLSNGEHTVGIVLDPNGQVKFIDGTTEFSSKFYVGDAGWGFANILLTIVFCLLLLILFFTYMGRGKKKKRT